MFLVLPVYESNNLNISMSKVYLRFYIWILYFGLLDTIFGILCW